MNKTIEQKVKKIKKLELDLCEMKRSLFYDYAKEGLSYDQVVIIVDALFPLLGLGKEETIKSGLSLEQTNMFSNKEFTVSQTKLIRDYIWSGIDVSMYAKPEYSEEFMKKIFGVLCLNYFSAEEKERIINNLILEN